MRMFTIARGSEVEVEDQIIDTTEAKHFMVEDIVIDPVGNLTADKKHEKDAKEGYYGFMDEGKMMKVHRDFVQVM